MKDLITVFFIKFLILFFLGISLLLLANSAKSKEVSNKYPGYIDVTAKPGSQRNIGEINLLAPFYQDPGSITFINLRGQTDNNDSSEINLGIGKRSIVDSFFGNGEMVYGYYGFLDARNSENDNKFYQVTLGYEFLSDYFDFRNNFYAPINQEESIRLQNQALVSENNTIMMQFQNKEKALYGSDIEFGTNLPWLVPFNKGSRNQFRVYGGAYYFTNDDVKSIAGPRVRAELRLYEADRLPFLPTGSIITISGEYQEDNVRGDQKFSALRLSVPLQKVSRKNRLSGARLRMIDPVVRDIDIVNSNVTTKEQAILPSGQNLAAITTATDDSSLFLATSGGVENSIVIVGNNITTSLQNRVKSGQFVAVPGEVVRVTTASGVSMNYVLPGTVSTKTITSTMPGQAPLAIEDGGRNISIGDITTAATNFDGTVVDSPNVIAFASRSSAELEGNIEAGTVLADLSYSGGANPVIQDVFVDDAVVEAGPAGCSTEGIVNCFEIDNGQFKVKDGVTFAAGAQPDVIFVSVAPETNGFASSHLVNIINENSAAYTNIVGDGGVLPNQELYKGVRLLYGSDFAANDNEKINFVKHIISNLLHHDNVNNGGAIQSALAANNATLTLYNNVNDLEGSAGVFVVHRNSQDLQADETFPNSFAADRHGRNDAGTARDAALEEIVHLIHNYGITYAYPEKQVQLNNITATAIAPDTRTSQYIDGDNDGIEDGNDLPRADVDDELFSGAVEAYLNHTAGDSAGYLNDTAIFQAPLDNGPVTGVSSDVQLQNTHADTYNLVEGIFGDRDDLLTRLRQAPNP